MPPEVNPLKINVPFDVVVYDCNAELAPDWYKVAIQLERGVKSILPVVSLTVAFLTVPEMEYVGIEKDFSFFKRVSQEDIVQILKYFNFSPLFAFLDAIGGSASGLNNFNLVSDGYKIEDNILEMIASYYYDRLEAEQKTDNVYIVEYYDDSDPEFESGDLIRKESEKVIRISHH